MVSKQLYNFIKQDETPKKYIVIFLVLGGDLGMLMILCIISENLMLLTCKSLKEKAGSTLS